MAQGQSPALEHTCGQVPRSSRMLKETEAAAGRGNVTGENAALRDQSRSEERHKRPTKDSQALRLTRAFEIRVEKGREKREREREREKRRPPF